MHVFLDKSLKNISGLSEGDLQFEIHTHTHTHKHTQALSEAIMGNGRTIAANIATSLSHLQATKPDV